MTTKSQADSLLRKVRKTKHQRPSASQAGSEESRVYVAWLLGIVTLTQISKALNLHPTRVYHNAALALRDEIEVGNVELKLKIPLDLTN